MLLKNKSYQIYSASEKRESKGKNGDGCGFRELKNEQLVVLCVSDGVGSLSRDWLASETTCKKFIEYFNKKPGTIASRMEVATLAAHSEVLALSKQSSMAATLVSVVVDLKINMVYYLSIGDSRIFLVNNESANLITVDDTASIPVTVNNSIVLKDGIPFYTHPITKAIGQREKLVFNINSYPFNPGESVVLATDGIHNHGVLPNSILELLQQDNLSVKLQTTVSECSKENNDDATILILRSNDFPYNSKSLYEDTILKNKNLKTIKLYPHLLINCACDLIEQNIKVEDWETVKKCLGYMYENKLVPARNVLISWLDEMLAQNPNNTNILSTIRKLIQISY